MFARIFRRPSARDRRSGPRVLPTSALLELSPHIRRDIGLEPDARARLRTPIGLP